MKLLQVEINTLSPVTSLHTPLFMSHNKRGDDLSIFCRHAEELTQSKLNALKSHEDNNAYLFIHILDYHDFVEQFPDSKDSIEELNQEILALRDIDFEKKLKRSHLFLKEDPSLLESFSKALEHNDFKEFIFEAKNILSQLALDQCLEESFISLSSSKIMHYDNTIARELGLGLLFYLYLQHEDAKSERELSCVLFALIFKDLGLVQLPISDAQDALNHEYYPKHPFMTFMLFKKLPIEFKELTTRLILEHHEKANGLGFPREKIIEHIHPLSFIVSYVSELSAVLSVKNTNIKGSFVAELISLLNTVADFHQEKMEVFIDQLK